WALLGPSGKGGFQRITKRRRFEIAAGAGAKLSLRVTAKGTSALETCEAKRLRVRARFTPAEDGAGRGGATRTSPLTMDLGRCAAPGGGGGGGGGGGEGGSGNVIPPATPYTGDPIGTANSDRCDFLDSAVCLQPWPNDYFTTEDETTDTGRRVNLNLLSMPA